MARCRLCSDHVERFRLMGKVYRLCRVRNLFEWPCPRYRTGYSVILTHRVWSMVIRVLDMHMAIEVIWVYLCYYYRCYIIHRCHILLIMILLIFLSPLCLVRWDLLNTFVLTYLLLCFSSRYRLRAWRVWVEGVRTRVDPVGFSCLSRVVL
jgi:hypothetical protein